jgi:hypothetical protein
MTTIKDARAALVTAVGALDSAGDPPACYVYSQGSDLTILGKASVQWTFRVACMVGYQGDDATASRDLADLVEAKLIILWALAGWIRRRVPDHRHPDPRCHPVSRRPPSRPSGRPPTP